jgi:hypothetical protein
MLERQIHIIKPNRLSMAPNNSNEHMNIYFNVRPLGEVDLDFYNRSWIQLF